MFGLPLEVTTGMIAGLGGFAMKLMAQKHADNVSIIKLGMAKAEQSSKLADAAAKRSSPWLRKFAAIVVLLVAFVGLFTVAWAPDVPVSIVQSVPQKQLLWGLLRWGDTSEVIIANGFVIQDWFKFSVITIICFLFGTGAAKVK